MRKTFLYIFFGFLMLFIAAGGLEARPQVITSAPLTPAQTEALNYQWGTSQQQAPESQPDKKVYRDYQRDPKDVKKKTPPREKKEPAESSAKKDWTKSRNYQRSAEDSQPKTTIVPKAKADNKAAPQAADGSNGGKKSSRRYVRPMPEQSLAQTYHPKKSPSDSPASERVRAGSYQLNSQDSSKKTVITIPAKDDKKAAPAPARAGYSKTGGEATVRATLPANKHEYMPGQNRKNTYNQRATTTLQAKSPAARTPEPVKSASVAPGPEPVKSAAAAPAAIEQPKTTLVAPTKVETPPAAAGAVVLADDLANSYRAFDQKYTASLGKSRKELEQLWGFPMSRMGENDREIAYGFRQRGIINLPAEGAKIQPTSLYTAGDMAKPQGKGQQFACLVVLWVDKNGRGVVVDGEAVGDCFSIEDLKTKPSKFER